jgi:hypothetical protein
MLIVVPLSLLAQTPSAILHAQGGVWVNEYEARDSAAIFSGDTIETKPGFSATLAVEGSQVLIQPESVTKFQGDYIELDHGGVSVETSRSFRVRVHCITVIPAANTFTQYDVTDVNGTVQVSARKSDVNVDIEHGDHKPTDPPVTQGSQRASVHESEQRSYNESEVCGAPPRPVSPSTSLSPKWIAVGGGGAAGVGVLLCLVVFCNSHGGTPPPVSASRP